MRKGLTATLMTIAIALIGHQVLAMAPIVGELPTPIIGDENSVTFPNLFVYNTTVPNQVINLDNYVTDDGPISNITWSYYESTGEYKINGVDSVDPGTPANYITPGALAIAGPSVTALDPADPDSNSKTIAIRNVTYSPINGTNLDPPVSSGLFDGKVVTLFASDGTTAGQGEMMVWTDASGNDRLSGTIPQTGATYTNELTLDFSTGSQFGWSSKVAFGTGTRSVTGGLCMSVPAAGDNSLEWFSPYGVVDMVQNAVWRIRLTFSSSQSNAALVPLTRVLVDNGSEPTESGIGGNGFFGDYFFFSNVGGADAVGTSLTNAEVWFNHASVLNSRWNTNGIDDAGVDPYNDLRIRFVTFDVAALDNNQQVGQVCLDDITVDRYDINDVQTLSTPYPTTTISAANYAVTGPNSQISFGSGGVTITPTGGAWTNEAIKIEPTGASLQEQYPVAWEANTLYMIEAKMAAATTATNLQSDLIRVGMDSATQELIYMNAVTPNLNAAGDPASGTAQTFVSFFYSHNVTAVAGTNPEYARLRPRMDMLSSTTFSPGGNATNTDGTRVESLTVKKVSFGQ